MRNWEKTEEIIWVNKVAFVQLSATSAQMIDILLNGSIIAQVKIILGPYWWFCDFCLHCTRDVTPHRASIARGVETVVQAAKEVTYLWVFLLNAYLNGWMHESLQVSGSVM